MSPLLTNMGPQNHALSFIVAAQRGHLLALYKLAQISKSGHGVMKSCSTAVNGFKAVAERSHWSRKLTVARRLFEMLLPADDSSKRTFHQWIFSESSKLSDQQLPYAREDVDVQQTHDILSTLKDFIFAPFEYFFVAFIPSSRIGSFSNNFDEERNVRNALDPLITKNENRMFSLALYSQLASVGYEVAQTNAAYILSGASCPPWMSLSRLYVQLDKKDPIFSASFMDREFFLSPSSLIPDYGSNWMEIDHSDHISCDTRSLVLYGLSAVQGNPDAFTRMGDFYYYGKAGIVRSKQIAVRYYQLAASQRHAHAIFNLGLMYEMGDYVAQDFHLAKRFFDQAAEFEYDARIPRDVALFILGGHKLLNNIFASRHIMRILSAMVEKIIQLLKFLTRNKAIYLFPNKETRMDIFGNRLISDTIKDDETKARAILHGFSSYVQFAYKYLDVTLCVFLSFLSITIQIFRCMN